MRKIIAVILFCFLIHPAGCKQPLIENGVRYVLLPKMEIGLRNFAYETLTRLHQNCQERGIDLGDVKVHKNKIMISGIKLAHDPRLQDLIKDNFPTWEADAAKNQLVMSLKPEIITRLQLQLMNQSMVVLKKRLEHKTELYPVLQRLGNTENVRILITLVADEEVSVYPLFRSQGILEFNPVIDGPFSRKDELTAKYSKGVRADWKVVESQHRQWYILSRWSVVSGRDIEMSQSARDQFNNPAVSVTFSDSGATRLESFSKANVGKMLAIVLDGKIYSAPIIGGIVSRDVRITGNFTQEEVENLVNIFQSGALPVPLKLLQERRIAGEMEFEQGIVFEFNLTPAQSMALVRKKLDQVNLGKYFLQQAEGGNLILNIPNSEIYMDNFNKDEFLKKLSTAVGQYNLVSVESLSPAIQLKKPIL